MVRIRRALQSFIAILFRERVTCRLLCRVIGLLVFAPACLSCCLHALGYGKASERIVALEHNICASLRKLYQTCFRELDCVVSLVDREVFTVAFLQSNFCAQLENVFRGCGGCVAVACFETQGFITIGFLERIGCSLAFRLPSNAVVLPVCRSCCHSLRELKASERIAVFERHSYARTIIRSRKLCQSGRRERDFVVCVNREVFICA